MSGGAISMKVYLTRTILSVAPCAPLRTVRK